MPVILDVDDTLIGRYYDILVTLPKPTHDSIVCHASHVVLHSTVTHHDLTFPLANHFQRGGVASVA